MNNNFLFIEKKKLIIITSIILVLIGSLVTIVVNQTDEITKVSSMEEKIYALEVAPGYVPDGFSYVEGNLNEGYVIGDNEGNQFVWVPVLEESELGLVDFEDGTGEVTFEQVEDILDPEFKASVKQYKGFYVARYEASAEVINGNIKVVSKQGKTPWTNIKQIDAKQYSKSMYSNLNIVTDLMSGYAYDAICQWIINSGIEKNDSDIGNYGTDIFNTGSNESYKIKNIYDIAGNVGEITTEFYGTEVISRGRTRPVGKRFNLTDDSTSSKDGFRVVLYKNASAVQDIVIYTDDIKYGDVNLDGTINASDAAIVTQAVFNCVSDYIDTTEKFEKADVDGNGLIENDDSKWIYEKVLNSGVIFPVQKVTEKTLNVGNTLKLNARVTPSSQNNVTWESNDTDIVSIDKDGNITANKEGTVTITATIDGVTASCIIKVINNIDVDNIYIYIENSEMGDVDLDGSITIEDVTLVNDAVLGQISLGDEQKRRANVYKADNEGEDVINAVDAAYIYQRAINSNANIIFEGETQVANSEKDPMRVKVGSTIKLRSYITPTEATNKNVKWISNNNAITVNENGLVTVTKNAISGTEVCITLKTEDGAKEAHCYMEVDGVKPTLVASASGTKGKNNWYTSDVIFTVAADTYNSEDVYIKYVFAEITGTVYEDGKIITAVSDLEIEKGQSLGNEEFDLTNRDNITDYIEDLKLTITASGEYKVKIIVQDEYENEASQDFYINIDKNAPNEPTIKVEGTQKNGYYIKDATITITPGVDNETDARTVYAYYKENEPNKINMDVADEEKKFKITESGKYYIYAYTEDEAGNSESKDGVCEIIQIDNIAPSAPVINLEGTKGKDGYFKSDVTVTVEKGIDYQTEFTNNYYIEDKQGEIEGDSFTDRLEREMTDEKEYIIEAWTTDKAGNQSQVETTFMIDKTSPIVNFESDSEDVKAGSVITITVQDTGSGIPIDEEYSIRSEDGELVADYSINGEYCTTKSVEEIDNGYEIKIEIGTDYQNGDELKIEFSIGDRASNETKGERTYNYAIDTYEITYNLAGGSLAEGVTNPETYNVETENFTLNNPTKEGYIFLGWTGSNGTTPQEEVTIAKGSTGDREYTANWTSATNTMYKVITHKMNLDGQTYEEIEETKYGTTGVEVSIDTTAPEGFTYDEEKSNTTGTIAADGSTVLEVFYTRNQYSFNLEKGTGIESVSGEGTYYYGAEKEIDAEVKEGYTWSNWTGEGIESITNKNITITIPASNVTLTANATINTYEITYNLAGGSLAEGVTNPETYNVETENFTLNNPTKEGYIFLGWTGSNGTTPQEEVIIEKGSTGDREYTANWENKVIPNAQGLINFEDEVWSNELASVEMTTESEYWVEYQVNGTEGTWIRGNIASNLNLGDVIYARLTDGINVGEYTTYRVTDIGRPAVPTIEVVSGNEIEVNTYTGEVVVKIKQGMDEESGTKETVYTINGGNEITITEDTNITLTENGEYIIRAITKDKAGNQSNEAALSLTITEEKYFTSDIYLIESDIMYISRILPNTTYEEFKNHIFTNMEYTVLDGKDGHEIEDEELVKTGDKLEVEGKIYQLVVTGDINKDGECDISDLSKQKRNIIQEVTLSDVQLKAADVNYDSEADITDLSKMVRYIIKLIEF